MAGEATPLQKANAIARLAGQYLKAFGAQEQARENKALRRRLVDAEARVAALEAGVETLEASMRRGGCQRHRLGGSCPGGQFVGAGRGGQARSAFRTRGGWR